MASGAALHFRLYDSTRLAIREASALGRKQEVDLLQRKLDRLVREAHEGSSRGGNQPPTTTQLHARSSGTKRQQQDDNDADRVPVTDLSSTSGDAGGEPSDDGVGRGRADECLGLMAEAFADDLDVLRQDSSFTGSSRNIAAMADMMR